MNVRCSLLICNSIMMNRNVLHFHLGSYYCCRRRCCCYIQFIHIDENEIPPHVMCMRMTCNSIALAHLQTLPFDHHCRPFRTSAILNHSIVMVALLPFRHWCRSLGFAFDTDLILYTRFCLCIWLCRCCCCCCVSSVIFSNAMVIFLSRSFSYAM